MGTRIKHRVLNKRVLKKMISYTTSKIRQLFFEKTYEEGENPIKYMFYKKTDSDLLIIVFSSLTREGVPARYNYVRTLKGYKVNKLFILDDLGPNHRGCYCLGKDKNYSVEKDTLDLINHIKKTYHIKNTIYCGSSKGGYCAINFGIRDLKSNIIVGACQYRLGFYFTELNHIRLDTWVLGEQYTQEDILNLDNRLRNLLKEYSNNKSRLFIHCSDQEHTWSEHIEYLLEDLNNFKYQYSLDTKHYKNHDEIVDYFPNYLTSCIDNIINKKWK